MTTGISVALCTHNGARFLEAQVRSICAQSCPPDEIVLSDDASTDGSVDIARRTLDACQSALPDRVIALRVLQNTPPLGVVANFEQAIRHCTGELIALCDQDDVWLPDRLSRLQLEMARRPDLLLIHSDARLVDATGAPLGKTQFEALGVQRWEIERIHAGGAMAVLLRASRVTGATVVFRRALADLALPFPAAWWHDEWLAMVAASLGRMDVIDEPLIEYRQHGHNAIGAPPRMPFVASVRSAIRAGGNERRGHKLARAEVLWQRLCLLQPPLPADRLQAVRDLVQHQRVRAYLPRSRMARARMVVRELLSGRYSRYSFGVRSAVRDLLVSA